MFVFCDAPEVQHKYFQDSATPIMEAIVELHDEVSYYLILVLVLVLTSAVIVWSLDHKRMISSSDLTHNTIVELVWTLTPGLVLVAIALPSFRMLYLSDEILLPTMTVCATAHQWYWSYSYVDFGGPDTDLFSYDSYLTAESDLENGQLRLLQTDNSLVLPIGTVIRVVVNSSDVIHNFAVPAFGVKVDAMPGRINQTAIYVKRLGTFYGQCSELCGTFHSFMPIMVDVVTPRQFITWLNSNLS